MQGTSREPHNSTAQVDGMASPQGMGVILHKFEDENGAKASRSGPLHVSCFGKADQAGLGRATLLTVALSSGTSEHGGARDRRITSHNGSGNAVCRRLPKPRSSTLNPES